LAFVFLAVLAGFVGGQDLGPGRRLERISTKYFDIFFPATLQQEARRLSSFADELRDELAASLGIETPRRFPVLMTDEYEILNGSYTPMPSERITLYAAPTRIDSNLGPFDDDLRSLFLHELVHALSLTIRSPFWEAAALVLGDPVAPAFFLAPANFIEGATVSMESSGGHGRVGDPLSGGLIIQNLAEGIKRDFWQTAGAWDPYPFGSIYYVYGGYFSAWLKEKYGEASYAELWKAFGRGGSGSGIEDGLFANGAFRSSFGLGLDEAWRTFLLDSQLKRPLVTATRPLVDEPGYIAALTAGPAPDGKGAVVYWADASEGAVLSKHADGGPTTRLFASDGYVNRLSLSGDGSRLLVSSAREENGFPRLVVREWDIGARRFIGGERRGIREAAYVGSGEASEAAIVAIATEAYRTDIVLEENRERRVLLRGGDRRAYGSPGSSDGATVYAIARDEGKNLLVRHEVASGKNFVLTPERPLDHLRYLSVGPESLTFGYADERGLYRLGLADRGDSSEDGQVMRLLVQECEISGGVHYPVRVGDDASPIGRIFYLGAFSDGHRPCEYPLDAPALAPRGAAAAWIELDRSFASPRRYSGNLDPDSFAQEPAPYFPAAFRVLRLPSIGSDLDSAGLALMGQDLTRRLDWSLDAQYSWGAKAANAAFSLDLGLAPYAITFSASDLFARGKNEYRRESSASLRLQRSWRGFPSRRGLSLGLGGLVGAFAPAPAGSPYSASYDSASAGAEIYASAGEGRSGYFPPFSSSGAGAGLSVQGEWPLAPVAGGAPALSLVGSASAATEFLGLEAAVFAAASVDGRTLFGPSERSRSNVLGSYAKSILPLPAPELYSYAGTKIAGALYAYADLGLLVFSAELQSRLMGSPLYARRARLRGGLRAGAIGAIPSAPSGAFVFFPSAYARLAAELTPLVGAGTGFAVELGGEVEYPFSAAAAGPAWRLIFGLIY